MANPGIILGHCDFYRIISKVVNYERRLREFNKNGTIVSSGGEMEWLNCARCLGNLMKWGLTDYFGIQGRR